MEKTDFREDQGFQAIRENVGMLVHPVHMVIRNKEHLVLLVK